MRDKIIDRIYYYGRCFRADSPRLKHVNAFLNRKFEVTNFNIKNMSLTEKYALRGLSEDDLLSILELIIAYATQHE